MLYSTWICVPADALIYLLFPYPTILESGEFWWLQTIKRRSTCYPERKSTNVFHGAIKCWPFWLVKEMVTILITVYPPIIIKGPLKKLEFQQVLCANSSHILLLQSHYSLALVNGSLRYHNGDRHCQTHRLKSEFVFFQSLSQLFQLIYFVKCKWTLFEPNS